MNGYIKRLGVLFVLLCAASSVRAQEDESATIETVGTLDGQSFTVVAQLEYYEWRSSFGGQYKVSVTHSIQGAPYNVTARHWGNGAGGPWNSWTQGQYWNAGQLLYFRATVQNPNTGWTTSVVYSAIIGEGISLCGPITINQWYSNTGSEGWKVFAVPYYSATDTYGEPLVAVEVPPFGDVNLFYHTDETCDDIAVVEVFADDMTVTDVYKPKAEEPEEPAHTTVPDSVAEIQEEQQNQQGRKKTEYAETKLEEIATDTNKTDAQKSAEVSYELWKAEDSKLHEIKEAIQATVDADGDGERDVLPVDNTDVVDAIKDVEGELNEMQAHETGELVGPIDGWDEIDGFGAAEVAQVLGIGDVLPEFPDVVIPTTSTAISIAFTLPGTSQAMSVSVDLAVWESSILIVRSILVAALTILFYFQVVAALREGFA